MSESLAQMRFNSISTNIGSIRTLHPSHSPYSDYQYALYYGLEVDAEIIANYIRGGLYWGHWNDRVVDPLSVRDMVTFSDRSHIIGIRFSFLPVKLWENWTLPLGIFIGTSHHFISSKCVGGFDFASNTCSSGYDDITGNSTTLEFGLMSSDLNLFGPLVLRGEIKQFIPLGDSQFDQFQKNRRAFNVSIGYKF